MGLDEQLAELLGRLGVVLEGAQPESAEAAHAHAAGEPHASAESGAHCPTCGGGQRTSAAPRQPALHVAGVDEVDEEATGLADLSLFQTSREHYGVFYRLDLVAGVPHLRIFTPEEEGALKMRCYLVRPSEGAPMRAWFAATRAHGGSPAYEESRDTTEQHLLFAAGETLKRLFWAGEQEEMRFPDEIAVQRLA